MKSLKFLILASVLFFTQLGFAQTKLYNFNFNLINLKASDQIRITDSIGFNGIVFSVFNTNHVKQLDTLKTYSSIKNGTSKILAAYLPYKYDNPNADQILENLLSSLKGTETFLWLVMKSPKADKKLTYKLVNDICKKAKLFGVDVVLYPHDRSAIESAEEALIVMKKVKADNLFLSIHLNHELRYNNANRLEKVVKKTLKHTKIIGISGANTIGDYNRGSKDWSDVVQPLKNSPYNVKSFYDLVCEHGYVGPFVLQNYGIAGKPQIHLSESLGEFSSWGE